MSNLIETSVGLEINKLPINYKQWVIQKKIERNVIQYEVESLRHKTKKYPVHDFYKPISILINLT